MLKQLNLMQKICAYFFIAITFLLPLKFGSLSAMSEASGFFPKDIFSWLIINWPAHSFGLFCGVGLVITSIFFPLNTSLKKPLSITVILWAVFLPLVTFLGWRSSYPNYIALNQSIHFAGVATYILAVYLILQYEKSLAKYFSCALIFGVLITCFEGLRQYFFGFDVMKDYIAMQAMYGNVSNSIKAKVLDTRVYSTMVSANILGGFLLLAGPFAIWKFRQYGKYFEPVKTSILLFTAIAAALVIPVFLMTKTRGAFLAIIVTIGLFIFSLPMKKIYRIAIILLACLTIGLGSYYIAVKGRGFSSMAERVDYMRTSAILIAQKPITGHGWGSFFYQHMKLKTTSSDESARDPHNVVLAFYIQTGILGFIITLLALGYPLWQLFIRRKELSTSNLFILWGQVAFTIHAAGEITMQSPAIPATAALLWIIAFTTIDEKNEENKAISENLPLVEEVDSLGKFPKSQKYFILSFALALGIFSTWGNYNYLKGDMAFTAFYDSMSPANGKKVVEFEVIHYFKKALQYRGHMPFVWELGGDFYQATGDSDYALECYTKALQLDPKRPAAYRRLAMYYLSKGNLTLAQEYLDKAKALFPTNVLYHSLSARKE